METEYVGEGILGDLPEDLVRITWSVEVSGGLELWGGTYERGPFDDAQHLRAAIEAALPFRQVEPAKCVRRWAIQLSLF